MKKTILAALPVTLALLGTAYELAALGQLDAALQPAPSAGRDLAQTVLSLGAARAFRCSAALRPPTDDGESAVKWALKLGALALQAAHRGGPTSSGGSSP